MITSRFIKYIVSSSDELADDTSSTTKITNRQDNESDKAIESDSDNPEVCFQLGLSKLGIGTYDEAIRLFSRAIELNPDFMEAYYRRGIVKYGIGDYKDALSDFYKAAALNERLKGEENPVMPIIDDAIGALYRTLGDNTSALDYYQKALAIRLRVIGKDNPITATSYSNIGELNREMGNYATALENYEKALAIRKDVLGDENLVTAASYSSIGAVYRDLSDYAKAVECYKRAFASFKRVLGEKHPLTISVGKEISEIKQITGSAQTISYAPSEADRVYSEYLSGIANNDKVVIDFHGMPISESSSAIIFGKLLITEKVPSVLCKNLDVDDYDNVSNIALGIKRVFLNQYPAGLRSHGAVILEPQIEINDPSGDGVFCYVKLGHDAYEAASRQ